MTSGVEANLMGLAALDRAALAKRWAAVFGCPAPSGCQSEMLRRILAHRIQSDGSADATALKHRLTALAKGIEPKPKAPAIRPGVRLARSWRGETHSVTVLAGGFEYNGMLYKSLSAIARRITGTQWSGPTFFGVRTGGGS